MADFSGLDEREARSFAAAWLPAWSGNRPQDLVAFYTEDAFYSDPAVPAGVRGRAALLGYFTRLLAHDPDWRWTQRGSVPMRNGFLNEWHASIPVGARRVELDGVCTVELRGTLICRNQVWFDRTPWLAAIDEARRARSG
jgi:hypothetical protein